MSENTTLDPINALVAGSIASLQTLLATLPADSELRQGISQTIATLNAKKDAETKEQAEQAEQAEATDDAAESTSADHDEEDAEEEDGEEEEYSPCSSASPDLDLFDEDFIAPLVIGFIAGGAVVGGGMLLHKLFKS
jgi:TATA-binding protein-associated factor Taf7